MRYHTEWQITELYSKGRLTGYAIYKFSDHTRGDITIYDIKKELKEAEALRDAIRNAIERGEKWEISKGIHDSVKE